MADERDFTTLPRRALADRRLSGMDLRVLGAISLHDGRSLTAGRGQGCWAGHRALARMANTDPKNVKRSTANLIDYGYLQRDADTANRRGFVFRVIPDSLAASIGGELTPHPAPGSNRLVDALETMGGDMTPHQQGANSPPRGGEMTPSIGGDMTPRIEREKNLEENHRIDSAEAAHVADRDMRHESFSSDNVIGFPTKAETPSNGEQQAVTHAELQSLVRQAVANVGTGRELARRIGVHEATVSMARRGRQVSNPEKFWALYDGITEQGLHREPAGVSIYAKMPSGWQEKDAGAQVAILERTLKTVPFEAAPIAERREIEALLFNITEACHGTPIGAQAQRLYENLPTDELAERIA